MRYVNQIFTADLGDRWTNAELLASFEPIIAGLPAPEEERTRVWDYVRFQLVGERTRRSFVEDWPPAQPFERRAAAFDAGANQALSLLAEQIAPAAEAADVRFDAVITTTATGNLMPGLSYRLAQRLGDRVPSDSLMLDLGNVGCTGSSKALNLVRSLDPALRNILVVAVEIPSTLANTGVTTLSRWQGNCTFGDGAAALWVSDDPTQGTMALGIEEMRYRQRADTGLDLIRWAYGDYYAFELADEKTFDRDVREHVSAALAETESAWKDEPRWAIHPAGITLLLRVSRKLGIPMEAMKPSADHYREHSNMSSVSLLHILDAVARDTPVGSAVNTLTMGAGFNVIYGRFRRER